MKVPDQVSALIMYTLLTAAVISDLRTRRISNRLILAGTAVAVILRGPTIIPNLFIPVILLFLFYVCGALGAGDIKLFSMIGGFITCSRLLWCISLSCVTGAVWSAVLLLFRGEFVSSGKRVWHYVQGILQGKLSVYEQTDPGHRICFTIAIFAGTVLSYWAEKLYGGFLL